LEETNSVKGAIYGGRQRGEDADDEEDDIPDSKKLPIRPKRHMPV
jgi:hypothetical protein